MYRPGAGGQFSGLTDQEFEDCNMGGYKSMPGFSPAAPAVRAAELPSYPCPWTGGRRGPSIQSRTSRSGPMPPPPRSSLTSRSRRLKTSPSSQPSRYVIKINYVPKVLLIKILSLFQVTACTPNALSCGSTCGCVGCMGSIAQLAYTYIQLLGHVTEDQ